MVTNAEDSRIAPIFNAIESDVLESGYFTQVNAHEQYQKPTVGLTASLWLQTIYAPSEISSLKAGSAALIFVLRMYSNLVIPYDAIDPALAKAASNLMRRWHDDFDFGGVVRNVDLYGECGTALNYSAGYLEDDGAKYRVVDITIPCLVDDVWTQA